MAHLTKPTVYNIEDTNIALLGSDIEKRVRDHAGDKEPAWETAGTEAGLEIWRVEQFHVVPWGKDRYGSFYDGDSYIVLHTFKSSPEAKTFSYNLHFWLGENTTVDEAGTAAYKTVELDDYLHGKPVQFREVQGFESPQFLSYFPRFTCLQGGVSTGFHHVADPPPLNIRKLYRITFSRSPGAAGTGRFSTTLVVRQVPAAADSLVSGDAYVLDKGQEVWQLNTKASAGQERYKAAEFVQSLVNERKGKSEITVFDEGAPGSYKFLSEFGENTLLLPSNRDKELPTYERRLFRISDASGEASFTLLPHASSSLLSSDDAFLLDDSENSHRPAVYAWIGKKATLKERRSAVQYAQKYLYTSSEKQSRHGRLSIPLIKMEEGYEMEGFLNMF